LPHRSHDVKWIAGDPGDCLYQIRALIIEWLRGHSLSLGRRVISLGLAIDRLAETDLAGAAPILEEYFNHLRQSSFDGVFADLRLDPQFQLETVRALAVTRLEAENSSRFVECYDDFMRGLSWTPLSTMEELADRYQRAARDFFTPFVRRHEHLLE